MTQTDGRAGHSGDTSGRFRTVRGIYRIHKRIPRDSVGIWMDDMSVEYRVQIFDKSTAADSIAAASDLPAPAKKAKSSRKDRHTAQVPGGHGADEVAAAQVDPANTSHLSVEALHGAADHGAADRDAVLSYIRKKYGNQAAVVIQILTAFEAYGGLFSEWRAPWEGDSDAYRAQRALRLARAARDFQAALVSLSNYKQKSWYTHAVVWIVWQQC